jgi:hypothetical protein
VPSRQPIQFQLLLDMGTSTGIPLETIRKFVMGVVFQSIKMTTADKIIQQYLSKTKRNSIETIT